MRVDNPLPRQARSRAEHWDIALLTKINTARTLIIEQRILG
jgi:hypothetical protein